MLRHLQEVNVTLNDKLEISVLELKYIGHLVSAAGIKPDTQKIAAIIDMRHPQTSQKLGTFSEWRISMLSFHHVFQNYQRLSENYAKTEHGRGRDHKRRPSNKLKKLSALLQR